MIKVLNNNTILKLFILFSWSILWLSINSMPGEINYMKSNFISFINGSRTILAIIVSFLSVIILFISLKKKKIKKASFILTLFLLYFIFQIFGLITAERPFDIHRTYLVIYAIGTISIFFLVYYNNLNEILPYLWIISLLIIFFAFSITILNSPQSIIDVLNRGNLYWLFHPDVAIFDQAPPRITGLTRALGLLSIFIIILLLYVQKINLISLTLVLFLFCFSTLIWMGQSRGSLLCFYLTSFIIIFLIINSNLIKKSFLLTLILILPIISGNIITNIVLQLNILETKKVDNINDNDKIFDKIFNKIFNKDIHLKKDENQFKENSKNIEELNITKLLTVNETPRVISNEGGTSGRTELWKKSIKKFEKNKIFGYGPQADRYLLNDHRNKYGNNVSNTILYALLSGGYFSLVVMITIFSYTLYLAYKFVINNKILTKKVTISKKNIFIILA